MVNVSKTDEKLYISLEGRIDTTNAPETEKSILDVLDENPGMQPVIDAKRLAYISSAGLRVLLKISKMFKERLVVENISQDIYDIFQTTGFSEIFDVRTPGDLNEDRPMREISIEGKEKVGESGTGVFYRLDEETVVKVYPAGVNFDLMIRKESENAKNAFVAGVPMVIAYDIVKVGDRYGKVYEMRDYRTLMSVIMEDKSKAEDNIRRFAETVKKLHSIKVTSDKFSPAKEEFFKAIPALDLLLGNDGIKKLQAVIENIPDRDTLLHIICEPDDVIVQGDELLFYDLGTAKMGHPVIDLSTMYHFFHEHRKYLGAASKDRAAGVFTVEEDEQIWKAFITTYLGSSDPEFIKKVEGQIHVVDLAKRMFSIVAMPGEYPPEVYEDVKRKLYACYDAGLEPICF